jgi:hypothetical protein
MKVQKAYMGSSRVLASTDGRVYVDGAWIHVSEPVDSFGEAYATWSDVPFAWIGGCPYWRA